LRNFLKLKEAENISLQSYSKEIKISFRLVEKFIIKKAPQKYFIL